MVQNAFILNVYASYTYTMDPEVSDLRYRKHCSVADPNWSSRDLVLTAG